MSLSRSLRQTCVCIFSLPTPTMLWPKKISRRLVTVEFWIVRLVLAGVGFLVVVELHESVIAPCDGSTQEWPNPIYPMVPLKISIGDTRTERTGGIQGASSEIDSYRYVSTRMLSNLHGTSKYEPPSSATNNARPMPTGAIKVALLFSAASINMAKTSSAVQNISMNRP